MLWCLARLTIAYDFRNGDLVLVDCGGEYNGYASDITRTWPVNGKFSEPQRKLYQAVLNVNRACIKLCTESHNMSLHGIHDVSVRLMKQELDKINFPVKTGVCDVQNNVNTIV
jgi:intermediate cleaving peptidase 55